jgi:exosortase/archaeosortase family protein
VFAPSLRRLAAVLLAAAGGALIALANAWRGVEATLSGHSIALATGETTIAAPARHLVILYKDAAVQSSFVLTSECSVAYLLAAVCICGAPLMLLRALSPWRTVTGVAVAVAVLVVVNVLRLTAIGMSVSAWGIHPGLEIAHTYFGSVLTVVGTCAAGIAFAAVLIGRRTGRPELG